APTLQSANRADIGRSLWPFIYQRVYILDSLDLYFFFFIATATTEIYTLSLHDALPISPSAAWGKRGRPPTRPPWRRRGRRTGCGDRKSTRLNSSHSQISYAVFCLKKKKKEL